VIRAKEKMWAMGLVALPSLLQKLREGRHDLLSVVVRITDGRANASAADPEARTQLCLAWWEANKQDWLIPFEN